MIRHHQRRHRREVSQLKIAQLHLPALLPILRVQANQETVWCLEVQPIFVHSHAAIADMIAAARRVAVMPDLPAAAPVDRPHVVRHAEIQDAVDHQRRRFHRDRVRAIGPGQSQRRHVRRVDLVQIAVPPSRVVSVVSRPCVAGGLQQNSRIKPLRKSRQRNRQRGRSHQNRPHRSVSRYANILCICASVYLLSNSR